MSTRLVWSRRTKEALADRSVFQCCSGFSIDLLQKLSEDIGFDYDLFEVEDRMWGRRSKSKGHRSSFNQVRAEQSRALC